MVKIVAMMVVKNEADRYLSECLRWTKTFVDDIYIYDDQSTDDTIGVATLCGVWNTVRPKGVPSFLEHEGKFRQAAWDWMCEKADIQRGDWVFALDADEFYVDARGERDGLELDIAASTEDDAIHFEIPEIFAESPDALFQRVDGWWGSIQGTRLVRWNPNERFQERKLGCGSVPRPHRGIMSHGYILHFGYLRQKDRLEKHQRYTAHLGHGNDHVKSILYPPTLEVWEGPLPFRTQREHQSQTPAPS